MTLGHPAGWLDGESKCGGMYVWKCRLVDSVLWHRFGCVISFLFMSRYDFDFYILFLSLPLSGLYA